MEIEPLTVEIDCECENPNHQCLILSPEKEMDPLGIAVLATKNNAQCSKGNGIRKEYLFFVRVDSGEEPQRCCDETALRSLVSHYAKKEMLW